MPYLFESKDWERYTQFAGEYQLSIPQLFQDLISSDDEVRKSAIGSVFQWSEEMLWEFGQVAAIPSFIDCLLDLAFLPDVPHPGELLTLAVELVNGLPNFLISQEFYGDSPVVLAEDVWSAFSNYADRFCMAISSSDVEIRIGAVRCLQLLRRPGDGVAVLQQLRIEEDQNVIQECLEALARFSFSDGIEIARSYTLHKNQQVQCRAWKFLAVNDNSYPNEAIKELAHLVINPSTEISEFAKSVVNDLEGNVLLGCVLIWIEELRTIPDDRLNNFVYSAITATFKCKNYSRTQLSPAERLLLIALCNADQFWGQEASESIRKIEEYISTALRLPSDRSGLRDWLQNESIYIRRR